MWAHVVIREQEWLITFSCFQSKKYQKYRTREAQTLETPGSRSWKNPNHVSCLIAILCVDLLFWCQGTRLSKSIEMDGGNGTFDSVQVCFWPTVAEWHSRSWEKWHPPNKAAQCDWASLAQHQNLNRVFFHWSVGVGFQLWDSCVGFVASQTTGLSSLAWFWHLQAFWVEMWKRHADWSQWSREKAFAKDSQKFQLRHFKPCKRSSMSTVSHRLCSQHKDFRTWTLEGVRIEHNRNPLKPLVTRNVGYSSCQLSDLFVVRWTTLLLFWGN